MKENFGNLITKLKCQFLCAYPLHCIDWKQMDIEFSWDEQEELILNTFQNPINKTKPVKLAYQLNFLKKLLTLMEKNCSEVHDLLYESLCHVQAKLAEDTTEKFAFKTYILEKYQTMITLKESKSFVAEGTTGLCSWQASLALTDYLLHHQDLIDEKNVIELGAGTGLCGFILMKCCKTKKIQLTDGSIECIELMKKNFEENFQNSKVIGDDAVACYEWEGRSLQAYQFLWNEIEDPYLQLRLEENRPDVILAADVIYDDTFFTDLIKAMEFIYQLKSNEVTMLLAATVRNEHTLNKFLSLLDEHNFCYKGEDVIPLEQANLYWDRTTPVKIFNITKTIKS